MQEFDIALIGLGVMGQSLARNLASRKINTLVYNRHFKKTDQFLKTHGNVYLDGSHDLKKMAQVLSSPRKVLLMVPAGKAVDDIIKKLTPLLKKGDIVIDGGNSNFNETIRRHEQLKKKGIHFVGMGVSGGEEGALRGPSIMPGGDKKAVQLLLPILKKIAAKDFAGKPCVTNIGTDGAGHYVKMVHNGIEYAVMQMMAEAYDMLKNIYGLSASDIAKVFEKYNKGKLKSYLFEISVPVLSRADDFKKGNLIDFILDKAGQKGTGRWTVIDGLERGATIPTIAEAVFARSLSAEKKDRVNLSRLYKKSKNKPKVGLQKFTKLLEDALYSGMISCYAQGFELIRSAANEQGWKINFAEISRIWEGGCIIRADMLNFLHKAFEKNKGKPMHLFSIKEVQKIMKTEAPALREVVSLAILHAVPSAATAAALNYFESMTRATGSANFIQGLRDFFGAHTYERIDREGVFHTKWSDLNL